jgi:EamA domain-containing membrane protein RarD
MERVRETIIALLMIFLLIGTLIIIYSLLIWQELPKILTLVLLFSLVLLKSSIAHLHHDQKTRELTCTDTRALKFFLLSVLSVFCVVIFISYLLKSQQQAAELAFGTSLLTIKKALDFLPAD